jgi:hypothetical protein
VWRPAYRLSEALRHVRAEFAVRDALVRTRSRYIALAKALVRRDGLRVPTSASAWVPTRIAELDLSPALTTELAPLFAVFAPLNAQIAFADARMRWLLVEAAWTILRSKSLETAALRAWTLQIAQRRGMLRFPEFFKVAVSSSGNHDNRSYNIYWSEKYQGLLSKDSTRKGTDSYTASANRSYAANLRGKLLLMHGDMDDNVHPAMTVQLIDELIKANKSFDLILAPNRPHSLTEPYFIRRRWDYFVQHLLGATPPENYLMTPADNQGAFAPIGGASDGAYDGPMLDDLWNRNAFDEVWRPWAGITPRG